MATEKFTELTPGLHRYIVDNGARRDAAMIEVEEATDALGDIAVMQSAPEQAALMTIMVRAIGARRALEVGTFTGYGSIAIARGLPDDGLLITLEKSTEYAEMARRHLERAGVAERTEIRLGDATESLVALQRSGSDPFDFAFIDADKVGYPGYYERCLALLRPGGLLMLDNVLLGGRVLEPDVDDDSARVVAELNRRLAADERIDIAMLGISDGITLALKR